MPRQVFASARVSRRRFSQAIDFEVVTELAPQVGYEPNNPSG